MVRAKGEGLELALVFRVWLAYALGFWTRTALPSCCCTQCSVGSGGFGLRFKGLGSRARIRA